MVVKYNSKTSEVTIKLSWTEVRQFLSVSVAVEAVRDAIKQAIKLTDAKPE